LRLDLVDDQSHQDIEKAAQMVRRDHQSESKPRVTRMQLSSWESSYSTAPSRKRAVKRMSDFSCDEKVEMLRQVTIDGLPVKDVAHDHAIKPSMLSKLIARAKKDKNHMNMMVEKQEEHIHHRM
jgi:transposase-like protein